MMKLQPRLQNNQAPNPELGLIINNITYPNNKYQFKYFAQSNILIQNNTQFYDVWNVVGEKLTKNDEVLTFINQLEQILFIERNDIIIGIQNNQCLKYDLNQQSIMCSTKLYHIIHKLDHSLMGCQLKQNILCFFRQYNNKIQFWNIKWDKLKCQYFLKFDFSILEQKQYIIFIVSYASSIQLMIQNLNGYKLLRRIKIPNRYYHSLTFYRRHLIIDQLLQLQQTVSMKHFVIDIISTKIKQIILNLDELCFDQIHLQSLNISIQLFRNKIRIYNNEYQLIDEKIIPWRNNTQPKNLEYNQKQGLIIFHSKSL